MSGGEAGRAECFSFSIMLLRPLEQRVTINLVLLSKNVPL